MSPSVRPCLRLISSLGVSLSMTRHRLRTGLGYGVVATIAMSILMLLALVSGNSPMPQPVPKAIVTQLFGSGIPKPMLMGARRGTPSRLWRSIRRCPRMDCTPGDALEGPRSRRRSLGTDASHISAVAWVGTVWHGDHAEDRCCHAHLAPRLRWRARLAAGSRHIDDEWRVDHDC